MSDGREEDGRTEAAKAAARVKPAEEAPAAKTGGDTLGPRPSASAAAPPPVAPTPEGKKLGGHFVLLRMLGEGGMGEVWEAHDASLQRKVAIKRLLAAFPLTPEIRRRFEAEAASAAAVQHPNVVTLFEFGLDDGGRPYFVMELLSGADLAELLHRDGAIGEARAIELMEQICLGVMAVHARSIVHRDLKPHNVFVVPLGGGREQAKLLDFGIAKVLDGTPGEATREGIVIGTKGYMAPEVATGSSATVRSDVYSLGVILFEMLTARKPFQGDRISEVAREQAAVAGGVRVSSHAPVSPWLERVVAKAMAARAEDRFATVEELFHALRARGTELVDDLPPGTRILDFEIERRVAKGGMGVVYVARHTRLDQRVALKFFAVEATGMVRETLLKRFEREGKSLVKVKHPNVVGVQDARVWEGRIPFLVMELVEGRTLRDLMPELDWPGFLAVMRQVAAALDAVHAAGVVHRDVTPVNILVDAADHATLVDFGLARDPGATITRASAAEQIGRYGYASPEQVTAPEAVDGRSDVWSVAAILYEALAGQCPLGELLAEDSQDYIDALVSGRPPVMEGIPRELAPVLLRALATSRGDRFNLASDLVEAVGHAAPATTTLAAVPAPAVGANGRRVATAAPTTDQLLAGSREATAPQPRRALWAVVATIAVCATIAISLVPGHKTATPTTASARPTNLPAIATDAALALASGSDAGAAPSPSRAAEDVAISVVATPAGSVAKLDGNSVLLPATLTRAKGTHLDLVVEHDGYESQSLSMDFGANSERKVTLVRSRAPRGAAHHPAPATETMTQSDDDDNFVIKPTKKAATEKEKHDEVSPLGTPDTTKSGR